VAVASAGPYANLHLVQADNRATTQFLQAGCPSCRPTNSVKALCLMVHRKRLAAGLSLTIWENFQGMSLREPGSDIIDAQTPLVAATSRHSTRKFSLKCAYLYVSLSIVCTVKSWERCLLLVLYRVEQCESCS